MGNKPIYQPWSEEEFSADVDVQMMSPMQRWMYRTLLQKAFVCSTRPFPPDDDAILWKMSGCPSSTVWDQHKEHVRAMFSQRIVNDVPVLFRQRLADDWSKIERIREVKKGAAAGRWKADAEIVSAKRSERLASARKLGTHTREEFQEMVNFFEGCCVKCGVEGDIVKDHIVPIYQGGSDSISNLQPLCSKCNGSKGPDFTDYRLNHSFSGEMPEKWTNACRTPAESLHKPAESLQGSKEVSNLSKEGEKAPETGAVCTACGLYGIHACKGAPRKPKDSRYRKDRAYVQTVTTRSPAEERRERTTEALRVLRDPGRLPENVRRVLAQK